MLKEENGTEATEVLRAMTMPETTEKYHLVYNKGLGFSHGQ
jgi:hypothetical protein